MRDVAMPYRAVQQEERRHAQAYTSVSLALFVAVIAGTVAIVSLAKQNNALEQRLAASETCLQHLHITMTRLDNPGPERGAVVASVGCGKE